MYHLFLCVHLRLFEANLDINRVSSRIFFLRQIVSYLLDLPEKDEEEVERAQINNFDTLWGETGGNTFFTQTLHS